MKLNLYLFTNAKHTLGLTMNDIKIEIQSKIMAIVRRLEKMQVYEQTARKSYQMLIEEHDRLADQLLKLT